MKASEFFTHWVKHANVIRENDPVAYIEAYKGNEAWTKLIVGSPNGNSGKAYPFAEYLQEKVAGLKYRPEEYSIDFVFSYGNCFENIPHVEPSKPAPPLYQWFYPPVYDIIFEHENYIGACWEEMIKLTRFRAKLKVLVTYNWHSGHNNHDSVRDTVISNFQKIITQANSDHPENQDTEYLLIIGERDFENDSVMWHERVLKMGCV